MYFSPKEITMRILFIAAFLPLFVWAQHTCYAPETDTLQARLLQINQHSLHAELDFEPTLGLVYGQVILQFSPLKNNLDSIWFDAPGIRIKHVYVHQGPSIPFEMYEGGLAIFPDEFWQTSDTAKLVITYEATPQKGLYFVGWDDETNRARKQVWTQGQGIDHRHWLPHVDAQNDKMHTSLTVFFDSNFVVIANGEMTERTGLSNGKAKSTWQFNMPHSSYLIMLAIGEYDVFTETSAGGISLKNYFYPEWKHKNAYTYTHSPDIFNFLENEVGVPYPWGANYKQVPVMNFMHGAMENTSATIFGDFYCADSISFQDRNYVSVNGHELAHQWFGNLVTSTHSRDHWLHEGFASFYAWQVERQFFGSSKYRFSRWQSITKIETAEIRDQYPLAHGKAGTERFYDKGGWVLHMLRLELGDSIFKACIKNYLNTHAYSYASSEDLLAIVNQTSGRDLTWFFNQWVFRPGIPRLSFSVIEEKKTINITLNQHLIAEEPPFQFKLSGTITTTNRTIPIDWLVEGSSANFSLKKGRKERFVSCNLDTGVHLLAVWMPPVLPQETLLSFGASWHEVIPILFKNEKTRKLLAAQVKSVQNPLSEIVYARLLGEAETITAAEIDFLNTTTNLDAIKVYLSGAKQVPSEMLPTLERWLALPSYDVMQKTLLLACLSDKANATKYLNFTKNVYGSEGNNVRVMWHLLNLVFGGGRDVRELIDFTSPAYDFMTRMNALEVLSVLGLVNEVVAENAFSSLLQNNRKLRNAARDFITETQKDVDNREIYQAWIQEHFGSLNANQKVYLQQVMSDYTFPE